MKYQESTEVGAKIDVSSRAEKNGARNERVRSTFNSNRPFHVKQYNRYIDQDF